LNDRSTSRKTNPTATEIQQRAGHPPSGRRRIEVLVRALTDLNPPLRALGAYLRAKFSGRFDAEGPGWPPLAQSTGHGLIHRFTGRITKAGQLRETLSLKRLRGQLQRDVRQERLEARVLTAFELASRSTGGGALGAAVRLHVDGQRYGRELQRVAKALDRAHAGKRSPRPQRAISRHRLLGKIRSTIKARLEGGGIRVGSFIAWAGVQNEGGPVGHGANLPARTFAELEDDDVDVFAKLLLERGIHTVERTV
jgi:phage gpG-like protein